MLRDLAYWGTPVKWRSVTKPEESSPCHLKLTTLRLPISRALSRQHAMVIFPEDLKIIAPSWPNARSLPPTCRKNFATFSSIHKPQADCSLQSPLNPQQNPSRALRVMAWKAERWAVSSRSAHH